jgi:hypothetical protein
MTARTLAIIIATAALPTAAAAQQPTNIGTFSDWAAYAVDTAKGKVCYALAQPTERKPEGLNRDPAYLFISTRPAEKVKNEISVILGFPARNGSEATVSVGGTPFELYTKEDGAWVRETAEEARLVDAMRRGRDLSLKATSIRGNVTTDTYSLSGISAALDKVSQECP